MKNCLVAGACAIALMAGSAFAGDDYSGKGPKGGDRKERMERMREHLELSDAQVEQIREIRQNGGGRNEVRAVLTEDQQAKLDAAHQRHREKRARHDSENS